jgi:hypothetical protein
LICFIYCKHFPVLSSPHAWLITGFIRRVPLVEQELLTLLELMSSHPISVGFLLLDFQFYVCFVCPFALFLLTIVMSVLITLLVSANSSQ